MRQHETVVTILAALTAAGIVGIVVYLATRYVG